jgi:hypothetical protein
MVRYLLADVVLGNANVVRKEVSCTLYIGDNARFGESINVCPSAQFAAVHYVLARNAMMTSP